MNRAIFAAFLILPRLCGQSLQIVEPPDASVVRPGSDLIVDLKTSKSYRNVELFSDGKLDVSSNVGNPPQYRFSVHVPAEIVAGLYHISAIGAGGDVIGSLTTNVEPIWPEVPSSVTDAPGVTVRTNGVPVERSSVSYPKEMIDRAVGGSMVVEVRPDSDGIVEDTRILSGPEEFRKYVIKTVLAWKFPRLAGRKPRNIEIDFDPIEAARDQEEQRYQKSTAPSASEPPTDKHNLSARPQPDTLGPVPQRIRVPATVQATKLISKVDPVYPALARNIHIQGVVRFSAILSTDGRVSNLLLLKGHPLLVQAAKEAAQQWIYSPTFVRGIPVEVVTEIEVEFFLE